jgi:ADP-ribose pyrophosphatase
LLEETGYTAAPQDWHYLAPIHNAIAYADEVIHLYLAKHVVDTGKAAPEGSEVWMSTFWAHPQELMQMVRSGQLTDVKTVIGVFWLDRIVRGEWLI